VYRLKPRHSIASEVRHIVDKQLGLAMRKLRATGDERSDNAVHQARRHIKKVRAVLRLVRPAIGDAYYPANRRMRIAGRLLAPIADGRSAVDTVANLQRRYRTRLPRRTIASIRSVLLERADRIDRKAEIDRVLPRAVNILRLGRSRFVGLTLNARGFRAIAPGLERSVRRARTAMKCAIAHPTADAYHTWRRRVKDLWFQMRLLEGRCNDSLLNDQRGLEALDGCLGELHNVAILERILINEALISRSEAARCLRLLHRYQGHLRRRAATLGGLVTREKPRQFVRRIKHEWDSAKAADPAAKRRGPWPRAA
jgi:CHAD domain-containing protein